MWGSFLGLRGKLMAYRILIIDDEEDIRTVAAMALDVNPQMDVRTCGSGAEGHRIAEWWQPHLILLDVRMPGLSGPETLSALRNGPRTASIPVIFFTASTQKHEKDGLMDLGVHGIISKPFDPMALAGQIAHFLPRTGDPDTAELSKAGGAHQNGPMRALLYVSRSRLGPDESQSEVQRIVATARERNEPVGITGALVFTHTHFAQFLEGPEAAIDELMERLREDPRHQDVRIVHTPSFSRRLFSDWSMAYGGSSVYVSQLVRNAADAGRAASDADKVIRLMREFTNHERHVA
jgi:CheY-like chemotaxis protein